MAQSCGAARWDKMDKLHILLDIFPEMALFRKKPRFGPVLHPTITPNIFFFPVHAKTSKTLRPRCRN
ncbi:hypothetical protein D2V93_17855 [Flagellimonas taeanensis]|nr:hypothetical protein D2V93_17855 [Allomuricauda taeanensis]